MSTNNMVPYSNPAGNNQTTPGAGGPGLNQGSVPGGPIGVVAKATGTAATLNPTGVAQANPLIPSIPGTTGLNQGGQPGGPVGAVASAVSTGTSTVPTSLSSIQGTSANAADSDKQLTDIYGAGVGGDINNLLNSIGGVNSTTLQQYDASLQPGFAQAGANLDASLGAGGVSANSSIAALGQANLQAQEQGMEAGENAQLLQSGQNLEASILAGTEHDAATETAQSGWDVFGQVLSGIGQDAGGIIKGIASIPGI